METLLTILSEKNLAIGWLLGALALVGLVIKILKGLYDFHYDYFTRRHLRQVSDLLPMVEAGSPHHTFLKQVIAVEVFKISSSIDTSMQKAEALMQLCQQGLIPPNQLKQVDQFLALSPTGKLEVTLDWGDKIMIGYSAFVSFAALGYGLFSFAYLAWASQPAGWIAGSIIFVICSVATAFFSMDFKKYRVTKRLEARMEMAEDLAALPKTARING